MNKVAAAFIVLVAAEHLYFLMLEMFLWTKPAGRKAFGTTPEFAAQSKALAANQGLYNGFLAAGLIWGLMHPNPAAAFQIRIFFLCCVIVAALFGGFTVKKSILLIQGAPALAALLALWLARS
jgi:putative membrane protein